MFKKAMLLAIAVAALTALAVPATSSAIWSTTSPPGTAVHIQEDETLQVTGQAKFQGQVGNVECQAVADAVLDAGTTTGHTQFDVDNGGAANDEAKCSVGGGLLTLGCTDVEQVTISGTFEIHAVSTTTIDVTTGTIQNHLTGGALCPKTLELTPGTVHITTDQDWWHTGSLSGTLKLHTPAGEQQVNISGQGSVSPATQFGIT